MQVSLLCLEDGNYLRIKSQSNIHHSGLTYEGVVVVLSVEALFAILTKRIRLPKSLRLCCSPRMHIPSIWWLDSRF